MFARFKHLWADGDVGCSAVLIIDGKHDVGVARTLRQADAHEAVVGAQERMRKAGDAGWQLPGMER